MFKRTVLIMISLMLIIMSGCAKKEGRTESARYANTAAPTAEVKYSSNDSKQSVNYDQAKQNTIPKDKKIIQNYQVSIITDNIKKSANEIENKAKSLGGYVEMEEIMEYSSNASIRIPSSNADLFIEYLEKAFEVTNKNKSSEDISDVYVDNDARLKNLRAEESQVLEILKKANTVDEILKVQSELYRIREEIEVADSRKKNWDRQVDYSTVKLSINKKQIVNDKKVKILSSNEFFSSMGKGFKNTFMTLVVSLQTIIIFLFTNLIPIGIISGLGYAGYRIYNKKKK